MTTIKDLGRRAVACKGWRPLPGALFKDAAGESLQRYMWGPEHGYDSHWMFHLGRECLVEYADMDGLIPVFSDQATVGCLLALVREAWDGADYGITACAPMGDTEAEALVAALEAAP